MPLQKQQVAVNFQKGLDTKTDPWQVPIGNFLQLENSVFTKQGLLKKRDGFKEISSLNDGSVSTLTTYKGELTAIGNSIYAYDQPNQNFLNKSVFYPVKLTTNSLITSSNGVNQIDMISSPNGLSCVVWYEGTTSNNYKFMFAVKDATSKQTLINDMEITPEFGVVYGTPKVFYLNNNFVVIFPEEYLGSQSLKFFSINCSSLSISATSTVAINYDPYPVFSVPNYLRPNYGIYGTSWDAVTVNNQIHVGYNIGVSGFYCSIIKQDLTVSVAVLIDTILASSVGAMTDGYNSYFAYVDSISGYGNIVGISGVTNVAVPTFSPQPFFDYSLDADKWVPNITGSVVGNDITVIYERLNSYSYFPLQYGTNRSNLIFKRLCTTSGVVDTAPTDPFLRGVGLNSRSFVMADQIFFSTAYSQGNGILSKLAPTEIVQTLQPCCFVNDINGNVVSQFNYPSGSGYNYIGIPSVSVDYFYGTSISGSNKVSNVLNTENLSVGQRVVSSNFPLSSCYIESIDSSSEITLSRIATQSGSSKFTLPKISLPYLRQQIPIGTSENANAVVFGLNSARNCDIEFFNPEIKSVEAGNTLNIAGGFLWSYDGTHATENNFFLGPDSVYVQGVSTISIQCSVTALSPIVTPVSPSALNYIFVGQLVEGTEISPETYVTFIDTTLNIIYISKPALSTNATAIFNFKGNLTESTGTGDNLDSRYYYYVTYNYIDHQGNKIESAPSKAFELPVYKSTTFTGDLSSGSDIIQNCSTLSDLQVGQLINQIVGIQANSFITKIDDSDSSNLKITISVAASSNVSGASLTTTAINQARIYFPTLRMSYKDNVTIKIYRQHNSGTVNMVVPWYSPINNDSSIDSLNYLDPASDSQVLSSPLLYSSFQLQNNPTPACSDLTIFDSRLWLIDSENGNNLWYSKPLVEAVPVEMSGLQTIHIENPQSHEADTSILSAITLMDEKIIAFKNNSIFYINGSGPDANGINSNYSEPIFITGTVGCTRINSMVYCPQGIIFQSNKGLWVLDRNLNTAYIGAPVEEFVNGSFALSGDLIPGTNQVRIALNSGIILMYDYYFQQWGSFTGINALSTTVYDGSQVSLNESGLVLKQTPGFYLDAENPVLMNFVTNWFALAGMQGYQRAYFLFLLGRYKSPHKLFVEFAYDFNDAYSQGTLITPNNFSSAYGQDPYFGSSEAFGGPSPVEKWRIMLERQKCDSVKIKVSEVYDASFGIIAGEGLTLSGMNFIIGVKKGYGPISQFNTAG